MIVAPMVSRLGSRHGTYPPAAERGSPVARQGASSSSGRRYTGRSGADVERLAPTDGRRRSPGGLPMARYRSHRTTQGRTQAAARALWRATGTREEDLDKPVVAIANSYTEFVPGHVH